MGGSPITPKNCIFGKIFKRTETSFPIHRMGMDAIRMLATEGIARPWNICVVK